MVSGDAPGWAHALARQISTALSSRRVPTFSVANLPPATPSGQVIYVPDEAGGSVLAFSDGAAWRRSTDRNVVS